MTLMAMATDGDDDGGARTTTTTGMATNKMAMAAWILAAMALTMLTTRATTATRRC